MTERRNGHSNNNGQQKKDKQGKGGQQLVSPGRLDFKKADKAFEKLVRENQQWLKEMADR